MNPNGALRTGATRARQRRVPTVVVHHAHLRVPASAMTRLGSFVVGTTAPVLAGAVVFTAAGCGGLAKDGPDDGNQATAGAGGTAGSSGRAGAGGTAGSSGQAGAGGTAGSSGRAGAGGTAGSSGRAGAGGTGGEITCYTDDPCWDEAWCGSDPSKLYQAHFTPCCETPDDELCSGGRCQSTTETCAAGTACVTSESGHAHYIVTATCEPVEDLCGGPDAVGCPDGMFCDHAHLNHYTSPCLATQFGRYGRCVTRPDPATCESGTETVCGCDGVEYESDCHRAAAGVVRSDPGLCSSQ